MRHKTFTTQRSVFVGIFLSSLFLCGCSPENKKPSKPKPEFITFNGRVNDSRTYIVDGDGTAKQPAKFNDHSSGTMVINYRVDERDEQGHSGKTTFKIKPEYFSIRSQNNIKNRAFSSSGRQAHTQNYFYTMMMDGFRLDANMNNGKVGQLQSDYPLLQLFLSRKSKATGAGLEKIFYLPTVPMKIHPKVGEAQTVRQPNGFVTTMKVIRVTRDHAVIALVSNQGIPELAGDGQQPPVTDNSEYYAMMMTVNLYTGWLERMVKIDHYNDMTESVPVRYQEKSVMYGAHAFRSDYIAVRWGNDQQLSPQRYHYQQPVASAVTVQQALPSATGTLTGQYDDAYKLHYPVNGAYRNQLRLSQLQRPGSTSMVTAYFDISKTPSAETSSVVLWVKESAWQKNHPASLAKLSGTAEYYGYSLTQHSLPVNAHQATHLELDDISASLTPVSGKDNTFVLTLYGANNDTFLWTAIPELTGATVRSLAKSDITLNALTDSDQRMLAMAERRQTYQIHFPENHPLPNQLTLTEKVTNSHPTFSKQVVFSHSTAHP